MDKLSRKEIQRSMRDFDSVMTDLLNTDIDTYDTLLKRFVLFIENNVFLRKIIDPILNVEIDFSKIMIDLNNGWYQIKLPVDIKDHLAFLIQLFYTYKNDDENKTIMGLVDRAYPQPSGIGRYNSLQEFNAQVVAPGLRELINKINDFIEDEVEDREDIPISAIQIFNYGTIKSESGDIAFGKDISINKIYNIQEFRENYIKILLDNNFKIDVIDNLRPIIDNIQTEVCRKKLDKSKIKVYLNKLLQVGGKLAVQLFIQVITNPELVVIAKEVLDKI